MKQILLSISLVLAVILSAFCQADCSTIYVSVSGSGNTGSIDNPTSILEALSIYNNDPSRNRAIVLAGSYVLNQTLVLPSGFTLDGGYTTGTDDWVKSSAATTSIEINPAAVQDQGVLSHIGVLLSFVDNVLVQDINFNVLPAGSSATLAKDGASIYGIYVESSQNYILRRVNITTGAAANGDIGANGSPGAPGSGGGNGEGGCSGCSGFGGGGPAGFGFYNGGQGGSGAYGDNNGTLGQPGFGPLGGAGGSGGGGDGSTCAFGCGNGGSGGPGQNGGIGANGISGTPTAGTFMNGYYIPGSGGNGTNGVDGSGGGAGGGGGGSDCCLDDRGGGGGGGGGGGYKGTAGQGGGGGGSSIALFVYNNGTGGVVEDLVLNPGPAGFGGSGGSGGIGGPGGEGGLAGPGADNGGPGGPGGDGGKGGNGGNGAPGAAGLSIQIQVQGAALLDLDTPWPYNEHLSVNVNDGCTNSIYRLVKSGGSWDFEAMNASPVNDLGPSSSSFDENSDIVDVSFGAMGAVALNGNGVVLNNYLNISNVRELPMIEGIPDTLCFGEQIDLSTSSIGEAYNWTVFDEDFNELQSYSTQDPSAFTPNTEQWYYFSLSVKSSCCGWSVPVYDSLYTSGQLESLNLVTLCEGDSAFLAGSWQFNAGIFEDVIQAGNGCDSLVTTALFFETCTNEIEGCTYPTASNYDPVATSDDGTCLFNQGEFYCGDGTIWDAELQQCVPFCSADLNSDGVINTGDLVNLLAQFGTSCEIPE